MWGNRPTRASMEKRTLSDDDDDVIGDRMGILIHSEKLSLFTWKIGL